MSDCDSECELPNGGGFLLSGDCHDSDALQSSGPSKALNVDFGSGLPKCEVCKEIFPSSFLWDYFEFPVCNSCRNKDVHDLITRTQAKDEYLLKDCDLDIREPVLKFYRKKNPHNPRGHDMKLYLHLQIKKRALEIWDSFEKLEEELVKRNEARLKSKGKRFEKRLNDMRKSVRSKRWDERIQRHKHEFGEEQYDKTTDKYFKVCKACNQKITFEKM